MSLNTQSEPVHSWQASLRHSTGAQTFRVNTHPFFLLCPRKRAFRYILTSFQGPFFTSKLHTKRKAMGEAKIVKHQAIVELELIYHKPCSCGQFASV